MHFSRAEDDQVLTPVRLEASVECRSEARQGLLEVYCRVPQPAPWVFREWGTHLSTDPPVPKNRDRNAS